MSTRTVVIMRHAKSSWAEAGASDFERILNERGRKDAVRMGRWLRQWALAGVVSSPAARARQTVAGVMQGLGRGAADVPVDWRDAMYLADCDTLLGVVEACDNGPTLLVGHNPGLEDLVRYLLPNSTWNGEFSKTMPTAAVYVVEVPAPGEPLLRHGARLLDSARPKALPPEIQR